MLGVSVAVMLSDSCDVTLAWLCHVALDCTCRLIVAQFNGKSSAAIGFAETCKWEVLGFQKKTAAAAPSEEEQPQSIQFLYDWDLISEEDKAPEST